MNPKIKQNLEEITGIIAETVPVEAIYLFGSYANGTPNKNSDLDLYIVFKDEMEIRILEALVEISTAISPIKKMPMDIIGARQERFNYCKIHPTLERKIAREGVKLYG